jgi:hypothetical protein
MGRSGSGSGSSANTCLMCTGAHAQWNLIPGQPSSLPTCQTSMACLCLLCRYTEDSLAKRGVGALKGSDRVAAEVGARCCHACFWCHCSLPSVPSRCARLPACRHPPNRHSCPAACYLSPLLVQRLLAACHQGANLDASLALLKCIADGGYDPYSDDVATPWKGRVRVSSGLSRTRLFNSHVDAAHMCLIHASH